MEKLLKVVVLHIHVPKDGELKNKTIVSKPFMVEIGDENATKCELKLRCNLNCKYFKL